MYSGIEYRLTNDVAIGIRKITRQASEKVAEYAFREAEKRGWKTLYAIHKANILKETDGLFLAAVQSIAAKHPGYQTRRIFYR